jgi:predicted PurR-regulated permease PerM
MAAAQPGRLRVSGRSILLGVAAIGATLTVLRILASSGRVIAWVLIAASTAVLLFPAIEALSRRLPRGLAVAAVVVAMLGTIGAVGYGLVGDVVAETQSLQRDAPELAARVERNGPFRDAAQQAQLSRRTRQIVREIPERLRGGTPAAAIRSAATRGLAFLAVGVLTLFYLLHGPRLVAAAGRHIHDEEDRGRAERVALAVYRRAFGYARGTVLMSLAAGTVAFALTRLAGVPGPAPLALWVGLWDAVPVLGAAIGAGPVVALAAIADPARGLALAIAFVGYQAFENLVLQRRLQRRTVRVGPFLTVAAGAAGLELYGLAGALLAVLAVTIVVVVVDESAAA